MYVQAADYTPLEWHFDIALNLRAFSVDTTLSLFGVIADISVTIYLYAVVLYICIATVHVSSSVTRYDFVDDARKNSVLKITETNHYRE